MPPVCLPEAVAYCCSGIRSLLPCIPPEIPLMRDEAESTERKERKKTCNVWKVIANRESDYILPTFPTIAIAPERSGVILWFVGNTMVRLTKSLLHHLAWVKCIWFLWFFPFIVIPRSSFKIEIWCLAELKEIKAAISNVAPGVFQPPWNEMHCKSVLVIGNLYECN